MNKGKYLERIVIGVFGNKQHGKDTVSNLLVEEMQRRGRGAKQFALADPLKHAAQHLVGMPPEIAWGHGVPTQEREHLRLTWTYAGKNAREWLQWIGTELGRQQIHPEVWIDRAVDTVVMDGSGTQLFTISDCRFHNERVRLKEKLEERFIRFYRVKVYRPGVPIDMTHASESEVASMPAAVFDEVIDNDTTLEDLRTKVVALCDRLVAMIDTGVSG